MDNTIIAQRIKFYRRLAKMTQEELAEKANVSDTYIRKLEAGERSPSLEILIGLATALKTTPDRLILSAHNLDSKPNANVWELLNDCTPTEFAILYENMAHLKALLRTHLK